MGLFSKQSEAEKSLAATAQVVGESVGKVGVELMPADFVDFTIGNQQKSLASKVAARAQEVGPDKAAAEAVKTARIFAEAYPLRGRSAKAAGDRAEAAVWGMLAAGF